MRGTLFFSALMGDAKGYDTWAQQIAAGHWIGADVFYQAPLYPYFLGTVYTLFGRDLLIVRIVQAILGSLSCILVGCAAARFFGRRAGIVAGVGLALYAPAIFFDGLIQKSVLDVFFVSGMLALVAYLSAGSKDPAYEAKSRAPAYKGGNARRQRRAWIALGVAAGCLSLTRENAIVLPVVLAAWAGVGMGRDRGRAVALLAAGLAIVLMPVAVRNYVVSGEVYLTTSQFGPNFYIGNHPGADGTYSSLRFGRGSPEYERTDAAELAERAVGHPLTPAEVSSHWTDRALAFIGSQPGEWLRLEGRKVALLVNATEMVDTESQESHAEWSMPLRLLGPVMHFGVLVPLAVFGLWITWSDRRSLWVLYGIAIVYALSTVVFYVFARYRYPLVPVLMMFASIALVRAREFVRTRRMSAVAGGAALAMVAAVFANWPLLSTDVMRAITQTNLGTALFETGQLSEAEAQYRRAIEIQADYAPAYNNLGVTLRAMNRVDESVRAYQDGLRRRDDYPDLHYNLANALLEQNRAPEAAEHLRIAASVLPASAGVHNNLGMALAGQGKLAEAEEEFRAAAALDPASAKALQNLASVLASTGRVDEALVTLQRATDVDPANPEPAYDLGSILLEANKLDEAIAAFQVALRRKPDYVEAHNNLGIALGSQGRFDAAIAQFEEALRLDPAFAEARRNLQAVRQIRTQRR